MTCGSKWLNTCTSYYSFRGIWSKGASTATLLENIICTPLKQVPAYEQFYQNEQKNVRLLKPFGGMAIVSRRAKIRSKFNWHNDDDDENVDDLRTNDWIPALPIIVVVVICPYVIYIFHHHHHYVSWIINLSTPFLIRLTWSSFKLLLKFWL